MKLAISGKGGVGKTTLAALLAQAILGRPGAYAIPAALPFLRLGDTPYRAPGPVGGLTALSAGVLQWTLGAGRLEAERRRRNAAALAAALEGARGIERVTAPAGGWAPGWLRFPVRLAPDLRGMVPGWRRLGIQPGYPGGLDALPGFGVRALGGTGRWPGAEALVAALVTLPVHSRVTPGDLERIGRVLRG
jgi:dTDP-4-amino-4,6-dideoxygalactose transaminase